MMVASRRSRILSRVWTAVVITSGWFSAPPGRQRDRVSKMITSNWLAQAAQVISMSSMVMAGSNRSTGERMNQSGQEVFSTSWWCWRNAFSRLMMPPDASAAM